MSRPGLMMPAPAPARHRRNPVRTGMLDLVAKVGSAVTLSALVVLAATAAALSAGSAPEQPTKVVTFEIAGR
ncbi:MAG: hypothetical protein L0H84_11495 [Pseudonocardia sp.]|nr:hypothetical protein [Pseudonocardia sp.]